MARVVIDASAATAMLLPSQQTAAARAFQTMAHQDVFAPVWFRLEVRNAIIRLERRGILAPGSVDRSLITLERTMTFAPALDEGGFVVLADLARAERLIIYDAAYLDLALTLGAALASRDVDLIDAARRRGVQVFDLT